MIRAFYLSAVFLSFLLAGMVWHYLATDREEILERIDTTVALTGLASVAFHAAWYEPRLRRFEASFNPAFPELLSAERQSFVYGDIYAK